MSENCSHNCSDCSSDCASRNPADMKEPLNASSSVKKVIGVVSGKGGVGKTLVTSLLAAKMHIKGYNVGILDADITGPSVPRAFGLKEKAEGTEFGILPVKTSTGIDVMSVNLLLENETDPVVWRGPVIAGTVKQFWTDVVWSDEDFLFVDMPPGTGDVPLTVFQSLPIDGIVIVTSPQELVSMIVEKAVKMARLMGVKVLALVENMSYIECPDCKKIIEPFGQSKIEQTARHFGIPNFARMPIDPVIAAACDKGEIEKVASLSPKAVSDLDKIADMLENL